MGVTSVHIVSIPEGKAGHQVVDMMCKQLEALGAEKSGQFCVECETFIGPGQTLAPPAPGQPPGQQQPTNKIINLYHNTEYPATCFALQDNGTSLVADSSFDSIMLNLASVFSSKKSNKMECRGPRYQVVDFSVKIGSCSFGSSFRGILVEIEYGPCQVPNNCWDLIKEFGQAFLGGQCQQPCQYLQGRMNETFQPIDVIHQYNEHFNALRKAAVGSKVY